MWPPTPPLDSEDVQLQIVSTPPASLTPCLDGDPPSSPSTEKREQLEHCFISQEVMNDLGWANLMRHPQLCNYGQVRVFFEWVALPSSEEPFYETEEDLRYKTSYSANFTVAGILNVPGKVIQVYENHATEGTGGVRKLMGFEDTVFADIPGIDASTGLIATTTGTCKIYAVVPSQTSFTEVGHLEETASVFSELPLANTEFIEYAIASRKHKIALFLPHGGDIDRWTSTQIEPFREAFEFSSPPDPRFWAKLWAGKPNLWVCRGKYADLEYEYEYEDDMIEDIELEIDMSSQDQWHITSKAINESTFPALAHLLETTSYYDTDNLIPFQYAVSFHGFEGDEGLMKVIIGGRASQPIKDAIKIQIEAEVPSGYTVTYTIANPGGSQSHSGTSPKNIVNRLSANGIQIEQSKALRENSPVRTAVGKGVANALIEMFAPPAGWLFLDLLEQGAPRKMAAHWQSGFSQSLDLGVTSAPLNKATLANTATALPNDYLNIEQKGFAYVRAYDEAEGSDTATFACLFYAQPATLVDPSAWQAIGITELGALGASNDEAVSLSMGQLAWYPKETGQFCLVTTLLNEHIDPEAIIQAAQEWTFEQYKACIRTSRLAAWRNFHHLSAKELGYPERYQLPVFITGYHQSKHPFQLKLGIDLTTESQATLTLPIALYELLSEGVDKSIEVVQSTKEMVQMILPSSGVFTLGQGTFPAGLCEACQLELTLPKGLEKKQAVYISQLHEAEEVGRITWEIGP